MTDPFLPSGFVQGSPEWLEFRKTRIGASEAPIILGISPYKSALELYQEKTGLRSPPESNPAMRRGNELEPIVREQYELLSGITFTQHVVTHPKYEFLMASLDGVDFSDTKILEIKCCNRKVFEACKSGEVVPHYYAQIQHQFMCLPKAKECHYVCFNKEELACTIVEPDLEFQKDMLEKELEFFDCVVNKISPGAEMSDYIQINAPEFILAAERYIAAKNNLQEAKKIEAECKTSLIDLTDDGNCFGGGLRLTRCEREGVDYKKAAFDSGIDLSKYKKSPISYWKISEDKDV